MKEAFAVSRKKEESEENHFGTLYIWIRFVVFHSKFAWSEEIDVFWCGDMGGLVSGRISNSQVRLLETDLIFEIKFVLFIWSS